MKETLQCQDFVVPVIDIHETAYWEAESCVF
jgi:hypothetical protein